MKKTSCGIVVTDEKGDLLLAVVPWGRTHNLDIPKGILEEGEYPASCAVRELKEETGLSIRASQLKDLGEFKYTPDKRLHLFLLRLKSLGSLKNKLRCSSMMSNPIHPGMAPVPEVVGYDITSFEDIRFYKALQPVLRHIQNML